MEGVAVLREVLATYDVAIPAGTKEVPKVRNITSVPRHGARIVVTRRRNSSEPSDPPRPPDA
jgi:hypothetical protein